MKAASKSKATWRLCQLDQREVEVGDDVDAPAPFDCGRGTRECFFIVVVVVVVVVVAKLQQKNDETGRFQKTIGFSENDWF